MRHNFSSGLLAGVTAAMIWTAISLWQGIPTEDVGLWALVFLVATTVVTTIIAAVISRGVRATGAGR